MPVPEPLENEFDRSDNDNSVWEFISLMLNEPRLLPERPKQAAVDYAHNPAVWAPLTLVFGPPGADPEGRSADRSGVRTQPDTADTFDITDPVVAALKDSPREDERKAYQALVWLSERGLPDYTRDAKTLADMLKDPKKRELAVFLMAKIEDRPLLSAVIGQITGPDGAKLTEALIKLSSDPSVSSDLPKIIATVANRGALKEVLTVLTDGKNPERAKQILDLLKHEDERMGWHAAVRLAKMFASGDGSQVTDATGYLKMLSGDDRAKKQIALNAVTYLDDPKQLHAALELAAKPENARAMTMLFGGDAPFSTATAIPAQRLLELLGSEQSENIEMGKSILALLNSADQKKQADGMTLLGIADPGVRKEFLKLLENPASADGAKKFLDAYGASKKWDVDKYKDVYDNLANPARQTESREIIQMFAGDTRSVSIAHAAMSIPDERARRVFLDLAKDSTKTELVNELIKLHPVTLEVVMQVVSMNPEKGQKLLDMIANPATRTETIQLVKNVADPLQVEKLLELLSDTAKQAGAKELWKLLSSTDASQVNAGKMLVSMYTKGRSFAPDSEQGMGGNRDNKEAEPGDKYLAMLADPQKRQQAIDLLKMDFANPDARDKILAKLALPEGKRILEMVKGNLEGAVSIIAAFPDDPAKAVKYAEIITNPANRKVAWWLNYSEDARKTLIPMLLDPASAQIGEKFLDRLRRDWTASTATEVLALKLGAKESEYMWNLRDNKNTKGLYDALAGLAGSDFPEGTKALVSMLTDSSKSAAGQRVLEMLNNEQTKELALNLLKACSNVAEIERMLAGLNNPSEREGIKSLLEVASKIIVTEDGTKRHPAHELIKTLVAEGSNPGVAHQVLAALCNPQSRDAAKMAIERGQSATEHGAFAKSLGAGGNPVIRDVVLQLGRESNEGGKALDNLLGLMSAAEGKPRQERSGQGAEPLTPEQVKQAYERISAMLANPAEREKALGVLRAAENTRTCVSLIKWMNDPATAPAVEKIISMLMSGNAQELQTARLVLSLLSGSMDNSDRAAREGSIRALMTALSSENQSTRDLAVAALKLCKSAKEMDQLGALFSEDKDGTGVKALLDIAKTDPDAARKLLKLDGALAETMTERVVAVATIMKKPETAEAAKSIMKLLESDDSEERLAAMTIASLLSKEATKSAGLELTKMLADTRTHDEALDLLKLSANSLVAIRDIYEKAEMSTALAAVIDMVRAGDIKSVSALAQLLSSDSPETRSEGLRLLEMLNRADQRAAAIRILQQRSAGQRKRR